MKREFSGISRTLRWSETQEKGGEFKINARVDLPCPTALWCLQCDVHQRRHVRCSPAQLQTPKGWWKSQIFFGFSFIFCSSDRLIKMMVLVDISEYFQFCFDRWGLYIHINYYNYQWILRLLSVSCLTIKVRQVKLKLFWVRWVKVWARVE